MLFYYFCFCMPFSLQDTFFFLVEHRIKMEPLLYPLCYYQQNTNIINTIKGFPCCAHLSKAVYLRNYTNESWKKSSSYTENLLSLIISTYQYVKTRKTYTSSFFILFKGPLLHSVKIKFKKKKKPLCKTSPSLRSTFWTPTLKPTTGILVIASSVFLKALCAYLW